MKNMYGEGLEYEGVPLPLWEACLPIGQRGRQAVIGRYIVDFVCFEKRLVVEVDGGGHCASQGDIIRDEWLSDQGFEVLRFWNNDVIANLEGVFQKIEERLTPPSLALPARGRE